MAIEKAMCISCGKTDATAKCRICGYPVCGHCAHSMGGSLENVLCPKCYKHRIRGESVWHDMVVMAVLMAVGVVGAVAAAVLLVSVSQIAPDEPMAILITCAAALFTPFMLWALKEKFDDWDINLFGVGGVLWFFLALAVSGTVIIPVIVLIVRIIGVVGDKRDLDKADSELRK